MVKICDSALGLSGFLCIFWWVYLRGGGVGCGGVLIQEEFMVMFYGYVFTKVALLGGPICGRGIITDFYGML